MKCEICGAEKNYIKAGISKTTGNPYQAFWGCPNKCKKQNPTMPQNTSTTSNIPISNLMDKKEEAIREAQDRKAEYIKIAQAKTSAGEIVAAMIKVGELKSSDWFIKYKDIANQIYKYNLETEIPFD